MYEEKQLNKELLELRNFLTSLIAELPVGIIVLDNNGDVIGLNARALNLLGNKKSVAEALDINIADLIANIPGLKKKYEVGGVFREDFRLDEIEVRVSENETIWLGVTGKYIAKGFLLLMEDVTHTKAVNDMKDEFVAIASHQLRTPLSTINWYAEMLIGGDAGDLSEQQKNFTQEIYTASIRMSNLVNDLLNISRIETARLAIQPAPSSLEDIISSVIGEVEKTKEYARCKIEFQKPKESLGKVPVDPVLTTLVLQNLLTNAARYSPADKNFNIVVGLMTNEDGYTIRVQDEGIGISPKDQPRIFQKFFRADGARKRSSEGSGLGLYAAKKIMDESGGKLWFESTLGKGSTFYVWIPKSGMKEKIGERTLAKTQNADPTVLSGEPHSRTFGSLRGKQ